MRLNDASVIKEFEGLRLTAYRCPADVWTIGWGHTRTAKPGMTITEVQAEALLEGDVSWSEDAVNSAIKAGAVLNQHEFDALVSLVYNIGATAFGKSTIRRKLVAGDNEGAALEFPRWNKAGGVVLKGLVRRRAAEQEQFRSTESVPESLDMPQAVDPPDLLKPLLKSKEMVAGAVSVLTGVGAFLSSLHPYAQTAMVVGLIGIGTFIILNRLKARKAGER